MYGLAFHLFLIGAGAAVCRGHWCAVSGVQCVEQVCSDSEWNAGIECMYVLDSMHVSAMVLLVRWMALQGPIGSVSVTASLLNVRDT